MPVCHEGREVTLGKLALWGGSEEMGLKCVLAFRGCVPVLHFDMSLHVPWGLDEDSKLCSWALVLDEASQASCSLSPPLLPFGAD